MKTKLLVLAASLSAIATMPVLAAPTTYTIDPDHTQIRFSYSHFGFSNIKGSMAVAGGTVTYDPVKPADSSIQITAQADTVSVGVAALDEHLRAADFLDVANFPTATFKSTKVEKVGESTLMLKGDLTFRDKTLPTTFFVGINKVGEHPMRKTPAAGFDATGSIDRSAFGIDTYTMVTGTEVKLEITMEAFVPAAAE